MSKLKFHFENCYGLKYLKDEFDFSRSKTIAIYSPNGTMKTSFAKVFSKFQNGKESNIKDEIFGNEPVLKEIKVDEKSIQKEEIFVINSYEKNYNSNESITTLLVDEESKIEYDLIYSELLNKKNKLIRKLNKHSGIKQTDLESKLLKDFNETDFLEFLMKFDENLIDDDYTIKYSDIYDKDVLSFLSKPEIFDNLNKYFDKYNSLIDKSNYFQKGIFNTSKADSVANNLKKENYFEAKHTIHLFGDDSDITDANDFIKKLADEKKEIIENMELKKIEDQIKKVSIIKFRDIIENNPILHELSNLDKFKIKLWNSYLKKESLLIKDLIEYYKNSLETLVSIEERANLQKTDWYVTVEEFKQRFYIPFKINIENKTSAIIGKSPPNIIFQFEDDSTHSDRKMRRNELENIDILSQGEKRAFYLLNVMYNIKARIREQKKTYFVIDDIADSFDYKNKYAIIEYLKDIAAVPDFYLIILTHNFDFFRTIQSRNIVKYCDCLYSYRTIDKIILEKATYIKNPFIQDWKANLSNRKKLIASLPFIRNLIEYIKGDTDENYSTLTKMLHWREHTKNISIDQIKTIYETTIENINFPSDFDSESKMIDLIYSEADNCLSSAQSINLEEKIVLSIAIRISAEKFMIHKLPNEMELEDLQVGVLFNKYKTHFSNNEEETNNIKLLQKVCLMTPENLHLNSFMYEPIIDLSDIHLRELYSELKEINSNNNEST